MGFQLDGALVGVVGSHKPWGGAKVMEIIREERRGGPYVYFHGVIVCPLSSVRGESQQFYSSCSYYNFALGNNCFWVLLLSTTIERPVHNIAVCLMHSFGGGEGWRRHVEFSIKCKKLKILISRGLVHSILCTNALIDTYSLTRVHHNLADLPQNMREKQKRLYLNNFGLIWLFPIKKTQINHI
jgi:hypothetical protein